MDNIKKIDFDFIDEEKDEAKINLIAEIMDIENNDPLSNRMDDKMLKLSKILKSKFEKELDNIEVKELKILKRLSEIEYQKRKLISENYEIVIKVSNIFQKIVNELDESGEFDD